MEIKKDKIWVKLKVVIYLVGVILVFEGFCFVSEIQI